MKRFMSWLLRKPKPAPVVFHAGDFQQYPLPRPHIVHAPHLDECECGRAHPVGWICVSAFGGRS